MLTYFIGQLKQNNAHETRISFTHRRNDNDGS